MMPVSYTHLDVYKRQAFVCAVIQIFPRGIGHELRSVRHKRRTRNLCECAAAGTYAVPGNAAICFIHRVGVGSGMGTMPLRNTLSCAAL